MLTKSLPLTDWHRPIMTTAAIVTFARAVIGLYQPDYWDPRTPLDYAAAIGTSLSFLLLASSLWDFYIHHPAPPGIARIVWRTMIATSSLSAAIIGLSNFFEDALGFTGLGYAWVAGILALTVSLLVAGISAFWVQGLPRWAGAAVLACALGVLFIGSNGFFALGLALLALGWSNK